MIIYYANEPMQSVVYIRFNNFFTIHVMLKITLLPCSAGDLIK